MNERNTFMGELDDAQIMLINGIPTQNFGHCPDDPPEDWCLSVYGYDPESGHNFEHYFDQDSVDKATRYNEGWMIDGTKIEFCILLSVEQFYKYEDAIEHY